MAVRLFLFGPPRLAQSDGWMALPFERRSQLLVYLALRRRKVPRAELAATLWPQAATELAQANLRKTLFRTHPLPWAPAIVLQDQSLGFDGSSDVDDFEAALAQRRWADALEIANGPLLAGFDDDTSEPWSTWLRAERARLRAAWRHAARECLAAAGDGAQVLALTSRLLADDPLDESALRAQMLAHAQQGQPARAREAYRSYAAQLESELGTAPSAELQALHEELGALAHAPASTHASSEARIVGRTAERRDVRLRLESGCRLLSLIGPGGVGKSCLARHLLSELAPQYPEGAVYVPLDDVESPDAVGARLARELAVMPGGSTEPLQAVIAALQSRRMLLVLDNFEHLQAAAPQLQAVLDACPQVQLLVTSRVRLGLASEQLLPLDGLPCPEAEDADCLETFDAARLFVRAARAVDPALNPTAEAAAIVDICRLVDGLPLALEIAAGWTRVLPCKSIAAELRKGINLLLEADTTRPARHASMAAVFEQSWHRLSTAERTAWARLTVFHGGFTLEAARAVTGATLPVLAALTDQSLLRKRGSRADLHPLLRQLAAAQLSGEERAACSGAHSVYYLQMLVPQLQKLRTSDKETVQQVEVEFENVRAAWRWAGTHGPAHVLQAAAQPLMRFCDSRGRLQEGLELMREAATGTDDAHLRPLLDVIAAHFEYRMSRYADAQALAERALRATRATRDHDTRVRCYKTLGGCAQQLGQMARARRRYRQALAQAPAAIDPHNAVLQLENLATVETMLGRYDAARTLFAQALVEYRQLGDSGSEAICLNNLATLELEAGQLDVAAAHLEASLALCERHALASVQMVVLATCTELAVRRNDAAAAHRHGQRAFELASQMGVRDFQSWLQLQFAQLAVQQRDLSGARKALAAAVEGAVALDVATQQLDCVLCFADLLHAHGQPAAALRLLRYAQAHPATANGARERAHGRLAEWSATHADAASLAAPAIDLWTLLHRIVGEAPVAHAPLIESLRG